MEGKCGKYVKDLTSLTEKGGKGEQYAKNVTDTCQSITNCYAGIKCTESQEQKIVYDQKCEKLFFEHHNISRCVENFYDVVYHGNVSCVKEFNYFSKDMRIRRGAYTSGKSCLLGFAKKNCSESAINYLNSDYERFLEIMTTPSDEEKCDSLHDELMAMQCEPELKDMFTDVSATKMTALEGYSIMNNMTKKCGSLKQCVSEFCYFNATVLDKVDELCEIFNSTIRTTTFDACFTKISMEADVTKYECIHYIPSNSTSIMGSALATAKMMKFLDDKSCVKTVMKGECDPRALENFDEGWNDLQRDRRTKMMFQRDLDNLIFTATFYVDGSVKHCSAEQTSYMKGKCGKYVNDLTTLTEKGGKGEQYAKNVTDTCHNITNCYAGIKCTESQEQKIIYDEKCEKLYFENQNITKCIRKFHDSVYQGSTSCVKEFNYFSKDLRIRRGAYTSGKSCLLYFANEHCTASAIEYLNSDYERFLEIMTTPSDDSKCESLHNELIATQCEPELKEIFWDVLAKKMASVEGHTIENDLAKKCGSLKQCMSDNCYYNATLLDKVDEICEFAVNSTVRGTTFETCYSKISVEVDVTKYECIDYTPSKTPMGSAIATAKMLEFLEDKSCVKTVMKGECDPRALEDFDEGWENLQRNRKMKMMFQRDLDKLM